jgi:hypothetical protein
MVHEENVVITQAKPLLLSVRAPSGCRNHPPDRSETCVASSVPRASPTRPRASSRTLVQLRGVRAQARQSLARVCLMPQERGGRPPLPASTPLAIALGTVPREDPTRRDVRKTSGFRVPVESARTHLANSQETRCNHQCEIAPWPLSNLVIPLPC